jgi:hypothetical protein
MYRYAGCERSERPRAIAAPRLLGAVTEYTKTAYDLTLALVLARHVDHGVERPILHSQGFL